MWKTLARLCSASSIAVAAALLLASPQAALADWWTEEGWYETGIYDDNEYYEEYGDYYDEDWGTEWNDWW